MAKKSAASQIARPKPPKVMHLSGKHKDGFIAAARRQVAKLRAAQLTHAK